MKKPLKPLVGDGRRKAIGSLNKQPSNPLRRWWKKTKKCIGKKKKLSGRCLREITKRSEKSRFCGRLSKLPKENHTNKS